MVERIQLSGIIKEGLNGDRLDRALSVLFPGYSRTKLQAFIKSGEVTVNGGTIEKQRYRVTTGEVIQINSEEIAQQEDAAEDIPLDIIHEDEQIIILNKPPGLVVHPGAGNRNHTLVNALLNFDADLALLPRAGIVHRLDKDTSGIMMVARTLKSHVYLINEMKRGKVKRVYQAVVCGELASDGKIERPISRHPVSRTKMAVTQNGKPALTYYKILTRYKGYTYIQLILGTGRTHQIRVHMASLKHPLVGDPAYGNRVRIAKKPCTKLQAEILGFKRQALHAKALGLIHPATEKTAWWQTDLPADMQSLLHTCENEAAIIDE